ncbi:MAG: hypothetical protein U0169_19520 [Polyangiaceae bacterium]
MPVDVVGEGTDDGEVWREGTVPASEATEGSGDVTTVGADGAPASVWAVAVVDAVSVASPNDSVHVVRARGEERRNEGRGEERDARASRAAWRERLAALGTGKSNASTNAKPL